LYVPFDSLTQYYSFSQSAPLFINALLFWYGSTLLRSGEYTLIKFFVCMMAIVFGAQGAGQFFSFSPDITKATSATLSVTRLLEHQPDIDVWSNEGKSVQQLEGGHIEFKNVYFSYPTRYVALNFLI
jgi:ATP-binding cassette, subfamily B (MDR/TAP), member 1